MSESSKTEENRGKVPGSGRKKGSKNKITANVKNMLLEALDADGGGVEYFKKQKEENPVSFNALISRIIPREIQADVSGSMDFNGKTGLADAVALMNGAGFNVDDLDKTL